MKEVKGRQHSPGFAFRLLPCLTILKLFVSASKTNVLSYHLLSMNHAYLKDKLPLITAGISS